MNAEKKKVSEAQKRAQKKYDEKTKKVSLNFSPQTMPVHDKLKEYTNETGKSVNGFIIELIERFFENEKSAVLDVPVKPVLPNFNDNYSQHYTASVSDECITTLNELFDSAIAEKILSEFYDSQKAYLDEACENIEVQFERWVENTSADLREKNEETQEEIVNRCNSEEDLIQYLGMDLKKVLEDMCISIDPSVSYM